MAADFHTAFNLALALIFILPLNGVAALLDESVLGTPSVALACAARETLHIGDKNLMELASKKIKRNLSFSKEGAAEIGAFHQEVLDNLKLGISTFMTGDVTVARRLITEKTNLRAAEFAAAESHLARLREGRAESIESSSLHLDILRDLKRIHSHICSAAYPVLERMGELLRLSRGDPRDDRQQLYQSAG